MDMRTRRKAAQEHLLKFQPAPLTDEQEWEQWRSFVGTKHICDTCGAVVGEPDSHAEWHARIGG